MTLICPVPAGTFNTWTFFLAWTVMLWVSGAPVNAREPNLNISALFSSPSSPTRHLRNPLPLCPVEGEAPLSNVHTVLLPGISKNETATNMDQSWGVVLATETPGNTVFVPRSSRLELSS